MLKIIISLVIKTHDKRIHKNTHAKISPFLKYQLTQNPLNTRKHAKKEHETHLPVEYRLGTLCSKTNSARILNIVFVRNIF